MQISLAIPPELKQHLVMDHDAIKKEGKLLNLPRQPNVEDILASYMKAQQRSGRVDHDAEQVANGLRTYFDRSLGLVRAAYWAACARTPSYAKVESSAGSCWMCG